MAFDGTSRPSGAAVVGGWSHFVDIIDRPDRGLVEVILYRWLTPGERPTSRIPVAYYPFCDALSRDAFFDTPLDDVREQLAAMLDNYHEDH